MENVKWDIVNKCFIFEFPSNLTEFNNKVMSIIATRSLKLLKAYMRDLVTIDEVVDEITYMVDTYDYGMYCNNKGAEFCETLRGYCSLLLISNQANIEIKDEIYRNFFRRFSAEVF